MIDNRCVMSLIRGLKGKFPCPVCLVPQEQQLVLSDAHLLCTITQSLGVLNVARSTSTEKEKEKQLKVYSLRDVEVWCLYQSRLSTNLLLASQNCFWKVSHCNIHQALSFDCLHSDNAGMWGDHLWSELQFWLKDLGWEAIVKIDVKFVFLP